MKSSREKYDFFPTPLSIAEEMAQWYADSDINHIVDLGCGEGNLFKAVKKHQCESKVSAYEIDSSHMDKLGSADDIGIFDLDLTQHSPRQVKERSSLIISNPPFCKGELNLSVRKKVVLSGLAGQHIIKSKRIRLEVVFLYRALEASLPGSLICFILPIAFLTSRVFYRARKTMLEEHCWDSCTIYENNEFEGTETRVVMIHATAQAGETQGVKVNFSKSGLTKKIDIEDVEAGKVLDLCRNECNDVPKIQDFGVELSRGKQCAKMLRDIGLQFVHSSHIRQLHSGLIKGVSKSNETENKEQFARAGDILISRVGTRCLGKAVMVESGAIQYSDSVICLRAKKQYAKGLFNYLVSDEVQYYFQKYAHGSCAKLITYDMIRELPVSVAI